MEKAFKYEISTDGIAKVVFDIPGEKVNTFSPSVIEEFDQLLQELEKNSSIKALILTSGKPDSFIAGADLKGFAPAFKDPALLEKLIRSGHKTFSRLQNLPFPSVAVIHGTCLGGGLECALACTYRVVTDHPKTLLALPETTLGIVPGWGGTQRLPRLVGLIEGLGMILSGRRLNGLKAYKIHLADLVVASEFRDEKVDEFIRQILSKEGKEKILAGRRRGLLKECLLEGNLLGRQYVYSKARKDVLHKTKGHYPAPLAALKIIEDSYTLPLNKGLEIEIQTLLNFTPDDFKIALNLIQLFFTQEALKKDTGAAEGVKSLPVKETGVIGAGTMGNGIAWLFSNHLIPVRMKDVSWDIVGKGLGSIYAVYRQNVKEKRMKPYELPIKFEMVSGAIDDKGFKQADVIVEAAVENLDLKIKILQELEQNIRTDAIIGTNTSSLTLAQMAPSLKYPERFIGMHFFNPVNRMPLVEIVKGAATAPEVVATAVELCKKVGKTPLVVKDCPGFLVNRIFVNGANEVMWMFQEGIGMERLEKVMLAFGMPMSPFLLADEVGNDVGYKVTKVFEEAYGQRMQGPNIVKLMYENKLWGKKTGKGFYIYKGKEKHVNPEALRLQKDCRSGVPQLTDTDIKDRVLLTMINEAARCLDEGVVESAAYLDMAMIMGTGFPPFRGGPLRYADELGLPYIRSQLNRFEEVYGKRFAIAPSLVAMENAHRKFYE